MELPFEPPARSSTDAMLNGRDVLSVPLLVTEPVVAFAVVSMHIPKVYVGLDAAAEFVSEVPDRLPIVMLPDIDDHPIPATTKLLLAVVVTLSLTAVLPEAFDVRWLAPIAPTPVNVAAPIDVWLDV
jgi:hypothetical protein